MAGFARRGYGRVVTIRVFPAVGGGLFKDIATRHQTERVSTSRQESTKVDIGAQSFPRTSNVNALLL